MKPCASESIVSESIVLVDSHCHLDFPVLADRRQEVLTRARALGVKRFVTIATHPDNWDAVLDIAETEADVYATVGIHPTDVAAGHLDQLSERLIARGAASPKIVGFGETGLDFYHTPCDVDTQKRSFAYHIDAARALDLPLIIHTREAEEETAALLKQAVAKGPLRAVIHCFTGTQDFARLMLELGFYISFSGIVTFKNARALQDVAAMVPLDRLLVETDAPYLAPHPHRGQSNEPGFVIHTAEKIGELRGLSLAQVAQRTTRNFLTLFSKVPPL